MQLVIAQSLLAFFVLFISGLFLRAWFILVLAILALIGALNMLDYPSYPIMSLIRSVVDFVSTIWSRSQFTIISGVLGLIVGMAYKSSGKNYKKRWNPWVHKSNNCH